MSPIDITPREELYRAALSANRLFARSTDRPLGETFSQLATILVGELGARLVTIGRLDRDTLSVLLIAVEGPEADYARGLDLSASAGDPMGKGPAGQVLRSGHPMVAMLPDALPPEMEAWKERACAHGLGGSALVPIHTRDGLWGLLSVYRDTRTTFSPDILPILESFSIDIGTFLDRREESRELEARRLYQSAIEALQARFLAAPSGPEILRDVLRTLVNVVALPAAWILEQKRTGEDGGKIRLFDASGPVSPGLRIEALLRKVLEGPPEKEGSFPLFLEISGEEIGQGSYRENDTAPLRSLMLVPLVFFPDNRPATFLVAAFSSVRRPREAVVDLLSQLGASTRMALSQSQDRLRLERYAAFYRALGESSQLMARHPPPQRLFDGLCELLVQSTGLEVAFISLIEDRMKVRVVSARGRASPFLEGALFSIDPEDPGRCLIHSRTLESEKVLFIPFLEGWLCSDAVREAARPWGLRNTLTVAIRREGKAIGLMGLVSGQEDFFDATLENLLAGLSRDITFSLEFQERQERLVRISITDSLTGLPNRNAFSEDVSRLLSETAGKGGGMALGILDLDGFKGWNDAYGHSEGDRLLRELADLLREILPPEGLVARLGGDEFGFCFPRPTREEARKLSEDFSREVLKTVRKVDHGLNLVTGSLGWALSSKVGDSYRDLLAHADEALYAAKRGGRNTVRFFGGEIASALQRRIETHRSFPSAIKNGDLVFWVQPQLDCRTGQVEGVEMLVRWKQGDRMLLPGAFMSEVEKDPVLIRMLGLHALRQARTLRDRFLRSGRALRVSLNIGASHFLHEEFLSNVDETVGHGRGDGLVLEVTESAALEDMLRTTRLVEELKRRGFGVSLDDFGTGYSSLHYAADLGVTEIKLDAYFLRRFRSFTNAFAVVGSTLLLADLSGSRLVGEGLEFFEDLALWLRMGGRLIQGYLLARPMPDEEIFPWLERPLPPEVMHPAPVYPVEDLPFLEYAFRPFSSNGEQGHPPGDCPLDLWFDQRGIFYDRLPSWNEARESHRQMHRSTSSPRAAAERFVRAVGALREEMDAYWLTLVPPSTSPP